jgi:hypothetical protein
MIELRYETIRKISTKKTPLPVDLVGVFLAQSRTRTEDSYTFDSFCTMLGFFESSSFREFGLLLD